MKRLRKALVSRQDMVSGRVVINILEKADEDALHHGLAVAEVAMIVGRQSGLNDTEQHELWLAGLFHDIGKLGVPKSVLEDKSATPKTKAYFEKHTTLGKYIVDRFFSGSALGRVIESHHERFDGQGYPRSLKAKDILWDARVIAIADYYDTARSAGWLLSRRSHDQVVAEIKSREGTNFDPDLVDQFVKSASQIAVTHSHIRNASSKEVLSWL